MLNKEPDTVNANQPGDASEKSNGDLIQESINQAMIKHEEHEQLLVDQVSLKINFI